MDIRTLNDAQKLLGDLQWLWPIISFTNDDLEPLRPLLKGTDPTTKVSVSPEQRAIIQWISDVITQRFVERRDPDLPVDLTLLQREKQLIGALTQCKKKKGEGTRILEWLFTSVQPKTTIQQKTVNLAELIKKGRRRSLQISGEESGVIYLSISGKIWNGTSSSLPSYNSAC